MDPPDSGLSADMPRSGFGQILKQRLGRGFRGSSRHPQHTPNELFGFVVPTRSTVRGHSMWDTPFGSILPHVEKEKEK